VKYRELVVPYRARHLTARPYQRALLTILESPARFRAAFVAGQVGRALLLLVPVSLGRHRLEAMLSLLPATLPAAEPLPAFTPAAGARRARVALLAGCVQRALRPSINSATLRVLSANGVEVVVPPDQGCCGALALHVGDEARANVLAERSRRLLSKDVDAIVTNAAGCGSAMKEQGYSVPVVDVSEFLDSLGLAIDAVLPQPTKIAYHDACHLSHGQGIRSAPRRILQRVQNVTLCELADGETCCGSAGLYNLEQPATAAELGRRKADAIRTTGAAMVAAGNIGCITQIEAYVDMPVRHTIEILDSAYSDALKRPR
jgi:glycolate oxidase iron-sulfur subunit